MPFVRHVLETLLMWELAMSDGLESIGDAVRRMQAGDDLAYAALIERLALPLRAFIRRNVAGAERGDCDADDIFQQTVFRAWQVRSSYADQGPGSFYRWMIGLAKNVIGDRLRYLAADRRRAALPPVTPSAVASELPASITSASSRAGRAEDVLRLIEHLDALPERRRKVVELHHLEGLTLREVAERLGVPKSTVFDDLRTAMESMREFFGAAAR